MNMTLKKKKKLLFDVIIGKECAYFIFVIWQSNGYFL